MRHSPRLAGAVGFTSCVLASAAASQAALIHRYSFNGTAADAAGTANGTLQGTATIAGGVLTTTGGNTDANDVALPATVGAGITGDFTIEDFVTTTDAGTSYATLFSLSNSQSNFLLANANRPNVNGLSVDFGPGPTSTSEVNVTGTAPLPTGTEVDLAITYAAASGLASVYVNGSLVGSGTVPGFSLAASANGTFDAINGGSPFTGDNAPNAATDDFRIYNTALSASAVAASFAAGPNAVIAVPEPATFGLLAVGGAIVVGRRRRRA